MADRLGPMRAVVYHDADAVEEPGGLIGRYLRATGWDVVPVVRAAELPEQVLRGRGLRSDGSESPIELSVHMGSDALPSDPACAELVDPERRAMRAALDAGVPVLGVCFGAQLLAEVLGGETGEAPVAEYGLHTHVSADDLCPPGPWVQSHRHTFTVPAGARELGHSAAGPQGLAWEGTTRALGWQFHPEVLPETIRRWGREGEQWRSHADDVVAALLDEKAGLAERSGRLIADAVTWLTGADA